MHKPSPPLHDAEALASALPELLMAADAISRTVMAGLHRRKKTGQGEEFWQFRRAETGDALQMIDWRKSARSDHHYVLQTEMSTQQAVHIWLNCGASMFYPQKDEKSKIAIGRLIAIALAFALYHAEEKVARLGGERPARGRRRIEELAIEWMKSSEFDYDPLPSADIKAGETVVLISDFLGERDHLSQKIRQFHEQGIRGVLLQLLAPSELEFPFRGRVLFKSMGEKLEFDTQDARGLHQAYMERLSENRVFLENQARLMNWVYGRFSTEAQPAEILRWLYLALEAPLQ